MLDRKLPAMRKKSFNLSINVPHESPGVLGPATLGRGTPRGSVETGCLSARLPPSSFKPPLSAGGRGPPPAPYTALPSPAFNFGALPSPSLFGILGSHGDMNPFFPPAPAAGAAPTAANAAGQVHSAAAAAGGGSTGHLNFVSPFSRENSDGASGVGCAGGSEKHAGGLPAGPDPGLIRAVESARQKEQAAVARGNRLELLLAKEEPTSAEDGLVSPLKRSCVSPTAKDFTPFAMPTKRATEDGAMMKPRKTKLQCESQKSFPTIDITKTKSFNDVIPPTPGSAVETPGSAKSKRERRIKLRALNAFKRAFKKDPEVEIEEPEVEDEVKQVPERLLKNREAAYKSRLAAKEKLKTLQDEHATMSSTIQGLVSENMTLKQQVEKLMKKVDQMASSQHSLALASPRTRPLPSPRLMAIFSPRFGNSMRSPRS
mmetsp:Transcript_19544/g.51970  ORF Transcript_19544/g.51970 Transcript_19544/m.51970 type:complete len:430 (-) Transcript_19544:47-1336(-)